MTANEFKTISEIAKSLSVSRQAVYQKIKTNAELANALQEFTVNNGKATMYSLQGQELIKQAFANNQSVKSKPSSFDSQPSTDNTLLDVLLKQLETKDKQIESLQEQLKEAQIHTNELSKAIDNLTTALQAAQALHGMEKQQKVIEAEQAAPEPERQQESSEPQEQQPPKRGFFQRLFGRH